MSSELFLLIGISFSLGFTPGPNNAVASYSAFNFGFKKTIPLILGVGFGYTVLVILINFVLISVFKKYPIITEFYEKQIENLRQDHLTKEERKQLQEGLKTGKGLNKELAVRVGLEGKSGTLAGTAAMMKGRSFKLSQAELSLSTAELFCAHRRTGQINLSTLMYVYLEFLPYLYS